MCGRSYDGERGISRLAEGWVSLAAAQQRRGRAGRVQPGVCFKLFSRRQADKMQVSRPLICISHCLLCCCADCLAPCCHYCIVNCDTLSLTCCSHTDYAAGLVAEQEQQLPEVCRTPLEQLCLTVKTRFGPDHKLLHVLSQMLTPPEATAITSAVRALSALGALHDTEALTPLGRLLSQIPMDPRLAKTCIFACMLRSVVHVADPVSSCLAVQQIWDACVCLCLNRDCAS